MPRVSASRSVQDRPGRAKLLLRRGRRLLPPAPWIVGGIGLIAVVGALVHTAMPGGGPHGTVAGAHERLGKLSRTLGWRVRQVIVEGRANTPEPLLRAAIGVSPGDPVLGVALDAMRSRVESLPWVAHAAVERRLPGTIVVDITERRPYAIWQHQGRFRLIDRAGQVLTDQDFAKFGFLPLVVGAGAAEHAADLLDALTRYPALQAKVVAAVRVGHRRWNLQMRNGTDVLLPEGHAPAALARLMSLQTAHVLLERSLEAIDMRLPDRLVLRPRPAPDPAGESHGQHGEADGRHGGDPKKSIGLFGEPRGTRALARTAT